MALTPKRDDDLVIVNRTGPDVRGGLVEMYELIGPGIAAGSILRSTLEQAKQVGSDRAKAKGVSLWYCADPIGAPDQDEFIETFRESER